MATRNPESEREDRLNAILLDYVEAVERGESPNRDRILDTNPEYAAQLREFYMTRDRLDGIAAPLRAAIGSSSAWGASRLTPDSTLPFLTIGSPANPDIAAAVGRIGDFRLLREIGRGGMGVVYEAEQISLRRRVALKILPFAAAIDPRHLQRFRNEAQAAAQLHHSNIVPVHAVGTEGGVYFYAMQFIEGQSLAQLLAELRSGHRLPSGKLLTSNRQHTSCETTSHNRSVAGLPSAAITTEHSSRRREYFRRMADLTRQAADALEYAHQAGIVHRDVKPANLLLDVSGRLWVTDFGLALIRSDVSLTATGELVGTVRYMSPEQALGKPGLVDHRTDIYSLGVTLYELLTLTPLFDGEDRREILRQLEDDNPRPPRAVDPAVPIELETIVLKAIAKLPTERYASAQEFAEDLRRFLDDRPILARRPSLLDRATKWVRRHRATAATAVGVLLLLTIGFAVSTAIIAREHAATKQAYEREQQANVRERQRAEEAQENYLRTKRAVDLFVVLSDEELLDFPPLTALRQRLLEAAVAYYQELTNHRGDPAVQADLEASRERLTRLQSELNVMNDLNMALLLEQDAVRAELALRSEQATRIAPLLDRLKAQQSQPPDTAGGRQRIAKLAVDSRREIEDLLTTVQYRRLRQIFLQVPGPHVFGPAVINDLGLTDTQRVDVRRALSEATQVSLRLMMSGQSRDDGQARFEDVWREATARIVALLTPEQRGRWNEMTGPPVRGEVRMPRPGPKR